ncbi:hypothetical protein N790_14780 [Arenimonas malthae CC-JY-1]|uniref:Uncharacterized protein n=1 Tax=Arenimonas malthae CC-JY-1 TaxID=1384054 RepID=A0A091BKV5_9GAMM|nr:hypothetical protein [Arenimonas malthae]KFN51424.1 hypothetical protein N790_14780 [Arenimonas malthae CC-JY-1]
MIFAVDTDDMSLLLFDSAEEAVAHCEGIDVEEGVWLFWDDLGKALEPDWLTPNFHSRFVVGSGKYQLAPAPQRPTLLQVLPEIRFIQGNLAFPTIAAVEAHLAKAVSVQQHGA